MADRRRPARRRPRDGDDRDRGRDHDAQPNVGARERDGGQHADRRDELEQVVRPVAAAAEHPDETCAEPRRERHGEHPVAPEPQQPGERDGHRDHQARADRGMEQAPDAVLQRHVRGRERAQRLHAEAEDRVDQAPGRGPGQREPCADRAER